MVATQLINVQWGRMRPGVTVLRGDGRLERAASVEHHDHTTLVWFRDGRLERHDDAERAQVLTHTP
jgi:hypothetical protein